MQKLHYNMFSTIIIKHFHQRS